ncbi:MAG: hypothetical protein ABIW84_07685 [Ilumatobacteraceae bacterium]
MNNNNTLAQERERVSRRRLEWLKTRKDWLACDLCGDVSYLLVRNKDPKIKINNIWKYSDANREKFLSGCIAVCRACNARFDGKSHRKAQKITEKVIQNRSIPVRSTRMDTYRWEKSSISKDQAKSVDFLGSIIGHKMQVIEYRSDSFSSVCSCGEIEDVGPFSSAVEARRACRAHALGVRLSA